MALIRFPCKSSLSKPCNLLNVSLVSTDKFPLETLKFLSDGASMGLDMSAMR